MEREDRPDLVCIGCGKSPSELSEYTGMAEVEGMTPDDYCWKEEGTLNRENGHFTCTPCYIKAGMPSSPRGWTAP
jgi:hypothetical protein